MLAIFVCILNFLILRGFCHEPECSKFAYDEKLLEKMIRMEVNVEKKEEIFKAEREEMSKSFAAEIDALKIENERLQASNERIEAAFESLKNEVSILSAAPSSLSSEQNLNNGRNNNIILFHAMTVKNTNPGVGDVILFETVTENVGDAFDKTSGLFTAPVGGLYLFHDQMCVPKEMDFYHSFYVDGKEQTRERYANDSQYPTCSTAVFSRILEAGQKVSVRCRGQNKSGTRLIDDSERRNTFSGFLVKQN